MDIKFIRENGTIEDYFTLFKDVQSCETVNTWIGAAAGDWHGNPDNWSLGHFPLICEKVMIPNNSHITISENNQGYAFSVELKSLSTLHVKPGGTIFISETY